MLKKFLFALIIAGVLVVIIPIAIAVYLSPQDELAKADAIVVISGGDTSSRVNEGIKLYFQKWAPKLIFSGAAATGDVSNALAMKRSAVRQGVSAENILIEEDSKTTSENAEFVSEILKDINAKTIILVTSPYHQRRAYLEFRSALGDEITIINHSAKDETWRKKGWWEDPNARFLTFGEMLKSFYSLLQGR